MEDVRDFPGHITCDGDSRSEIVVPILVNRQVSMLPSEGLGALPGRSDGSRSPSKLMYVGATDGRDH